MTPGSSPPQAGGAVLWLTGLSGAGKTTLARAVAQSLATGQRRYELLDGDALREVLPAGFSREEREAHVKRVGFLASRLEHHGVVVVVSLISPYRASRAFARSLCKSFFEVHVATSLEECERRDVKGLYLRARAGEIRGFTGIDDPYEPPEAPELILATENTPIATCAERILGLLDRSGSIEG